MRTGNPTPANAPVRNITKCSHQLLLHTYQIMVHTSYLRLITVSIGLYVIVRFCFIRLPICVTDNSFCYCKGILNPRPIAITSCPISNFSLSAHLTNCVGTFRINFNKDNICYFINTYNFCIIIF